MTSTILLGAVVLLAVCLAALARIAYDVWTEGQTLDRPTTGQLRSVLDRAESWSRHEDEVRRAQRRACVVGGSERAP